APLSVLVDLLEASATDPRVLRPRREAERPEQQPSRRAGRSLAELAPRVRRGGPAPALRRSVRVLPAQEVVPLLLGGGHRGGSVGPSRSERSPQREGTLQRRRTGIEPARELVAPSTVLKTAGPTRNPDASAAQATR